MNYLETLQRNLENTKHHQPSKKQKIFYEHESNEKLPNINFHFSDVVEGKGGWEES